MTGQRGQIAAVQHPPWMLPVLKLPAAWMPHKPVLPVPSAPATMAASRSVARCSTQKPGDRDHVSCPLRQEAMCGAHRRKESEQR